jgi:2'-5' RNA ligase superfamily
MALAVCLLFDNAADTAVRRLWERLEREGVPTLASHTHGRHAPHLTYASLRRFELDAVTAVLSALPVADQITLHLDAFGTFRRSRCWLGPAVSPSLICSQTAVVDAVRATGADLHKHYFPGAWIPHVTLAPRLHLTDLATVASVVYDVLPISARVTKAALIDTSTGERHPLPHLV